MAPALVLAGYEWLVVLGAFGAFVYGYGTGSNDVANAFGTSVGSKTLTMRWAVVLAVIFEFTGAVVLGRVSTDTIANGISNIYVFQREPEFYALGMMISLWVGGIWQIIASYYEYNVSATHTIIGCLVGFSMTYRGTTAVQWAVRVPDEPGKITFPPYKGVVAIVMAWFFSPVLTGIASVIIFSASRKFILRSEHAYKRSFVVLPLMVMLTMWVNIYFVFTRGAKKMLSAEADDWTDKKAGWIAAAVAGGCTFISVTVVVPLLFRRINTIFTRREEEARAKEEADKEAEQRANDAQIGISDVENSMEPKALTGKEIDADGKIAEAPAAEEPQLKWWQKAKAAALRGVDYDIHGVVEDDPVVAAIHANAEVFDEKAEFVFSYLQVFSAVCVIFSHGAGEVGYMAGPMAAIWQVCKTGFLPSKVTAPIWAILIGAFGLVFGLATYGYKVTQAVGTKLAKLSPSRGFAAELSTSMVIMIASQYGLPTSSSQCITGGIIGIAILEGKKGMNWKFLGETAASWIISTVFVALLVSFFFAYAVYSPSKQMGFEIIKYEEMMLEMSLTMLRNFNSSMVTGFGYPRPSSSNPAINPQFMNDYVAALNTIPPMWNSAGDLPGRGLKLEGSRAGLQTIPASMVIESMAAALALYQTYSIFDASKVCTPVYSYINSTTSQEVERTCANTTAVVPLRLTPKRWNNFKLGKASAGLTARANLPPPPTAAPPPTAQGN